MSASGSYCRGGMPRRLRNATGRMVAACGVRSVISFTTSPVSFPSTLSNCATLTPSSDFPFSSPAEKDALRSIPLKQRPAGEALRDLDTPNLLIRLVPYRCGYLKHAGAGVPLKERAFTMREVGRYIYPQTGMYCVIDGEVYDLGRKQPFPTHTMSGSNPMPGYLHSHPGGSQILRNFAGRDATLDVQLSHADWAATLTAHNTLRVGRIVEEHPASSDIDDDELFLFDKVYRLPSQSNPVPVPNPPTKQLTPLSRTPYLHPRPLLHPPPLHGEIPRHLSTRRLAPESQLPLRPARPARVGRPRLRQNRARPAPAGHGRRAAGAQLCP